MRWLGAIPAIIAWSALALGCRPAHPREASDVVPGLVMEGVQFRIDRGGVTRATGEAAKVTYRRDTTDLTADGLSLLLADAAEPVRVTAPSGQGTASERHFEVSGGLKAEHGTDVATTGSAAYDPRPGEARGAGLVRGEEPVLLTGKGYRLTGTGFTLDPATGDIAISGGARMVAGLPVTR
jgi:lipopolysaccharide export system protein LptC